jgi:hypothetical protein
VCLFGGARPALLCRNGERGRNRIGWGAGLERSSDASLSNLSFCKESIMKVKELKKALDQFDDNIDVILASDPEGNSFCLLDDICGTEFCKTVQGNKKGVILWPK